MVKIHQNNGLASIMYQNLWRPGSLWPSGKPCREYPPNIMEAMMTPLFMPTTAP